MSDVKIYRLQQEREMMAGQMGGTKDLSLVPLMEALEMDTTEWPFISDENKLMEIKQYLGKDEELVSQVLKLKSKLGKPDKSWLEHIYAYIKTARKADMYNKIKKSYEVGSLKR